MDGKSALTILDRLLEEDDNSGFTDDYVSYSYLNEAAIDFVGRTKCLTSTQSITTVADQDNYDLNTDFIEIAYRTNDYENYVNHNDGSNNFKMTWKPKEESIYENQTTSIAKPSYFYIQDDPTIPAVITGTVTGDGNETGGLSTLTDSGGGLSAANEGDTVHNTTDASIGRVITVTSDTALQVAMFNGTDNEWDTSDAYVVVPQGNQEFVSNQPFSTSGETVTVYYVQRPKPVYTDYGIFRFPQQYMQAMVKYAAWMYKYRDSEPNFGDAWYTHYERQVREFANKVDGVKRRSFFRVNWTGATRGTSWLRTR